MDTRKIWGMEIKAIREYHNLSLEFIAQRLNKSIATIRRYEGINIQTPGKSYEKGVSKNHINAFNNMLISLKLSTTIPD